jgi:ATP-dependent DNA helicase RecQ
VPPAPHGNSSPRWYDIIARLGLKNVRCCRQAQEVQYHLCGQEVEDKSVYVIRSLKKESGSGIIYVNSRKRSKAVAEMLVANDIGADFYHAGLPQEMRDRKQHAWTTGEVRIIVATNAFGMGIDKADVRFVIHWDCPDSIEAYYQESGRAGRDGKPAFAVLLWSQDEKKRLADSVHTKFPPIDRIKDVYEAIGNFYQLPVGSGKNSVHDFDLWKFVTAFRFSVTETYNSLNFLQKEGYLESLMRLTILQGYILFSAAMTSINSRWQTKNTTGSSSSCSEHTVACSQNLFPSMRKQWQADRE